MTTAEGTFPPLFDYDSTLYESENGNSKLHEWMQFPSHQIKFSLSFSKEQFGLTLTPIWTSGTSASITDGETLSSEQLLWNKSRFELNGSLTYNASESISIRAGGLNLLGNRIQPVGSSAPFDGNLGANQPKVYAKLDMNL